MVLGVLDIRRLEVLKAVVDAGSVAGASEALGYTPSAISQSLAVLGREAKVPLFEKAGRGIRPTQAGLLLAERAEALLSQLRQAEEALDALRKGQAGQLRLAAFSTAGATLVPRALARFKDAYPGVDLDLAMAETEEALTGLRSNHIDLAVIGEPTMDQKSSGDLTYTHVVDDPYRLVLPTSHPAAGKRSVALKELSDASWVSTVSARCNCLQTVTTACARAGFTPRFAMEADEFATTVGFVAAGLGVAMVPALGLSSVPEGVRVVRIRGDEPKRFVFAVTRSSDDNPMVQAMKEALRSSAGAYLKSAA
jgi:DNA-binding transcriptional LysR family regulator